MWGVIVRCENDRVTRLQCKCYNIFVTSAELNSKARGSDMRLFISIIVAAALVFGGTLLFANYFGSIETVRHEAYDPEHP